MKKRIVPVVVLLGVAALVLSAAGPAWGMYHPRTGRWLQRDPTEYADGSANLYVYASASPAVASDPTGEAPRPSGLYHQRGYPAGRKLKTFFFFKVGHTVISDGPGGGAGGGADFAPPGLKKIDPIAYLFRWMTGASTAWKTVIPIDPATAWENWELCIDDSNTRFLKHPAGLTGVPCCLATRDQVKECIADLSSHWDGSGWGAGHDCRDFVREAEEDCCLMKCP